MELLAEETDKMLQQIQARHARLGPHGVEGAVQDDRVPSGMEPFLHAPRNHQMWALSLEVRVTQYRALHCLDCFSQANTQAYDVISTILSKTLSEPSCVISSFTPTLSSRVVYIEAKGGIDVLKAFLSGVAPILHLGSNRSRLRHIPSHEWLNLMNHPPQTTDDVISPGTWVRVHKHGFYYGDLAVVSEEGIDLGNNTVEVVLTPRIRLSKFEATKETRPRPPHMLPNQPANNHLSPAAKNRRPRPPPVLFNESVIKNFHPTRSIRRLNFSWEFKGKKFQKGGYLYQSIELQFLTTQAVNPTEPEVLLFKDSLDPIVRTLYEAEMRKHRLRLYDRVQVHSGSLRDLKGYVVSIDQLDFLSIQEMLTSTIVDVPVEEVKRLFFCGDSVKILDGIHEGIVGFIVSLDEETAEVFDPTKITYMYGEVIPIQEVLIMLLIHSVSY